MLMGMHTSCVLYVFFMITLKWFLENWLCLRMGTFGLIQTWGFVSSLFQIWTVAFWFQEAEMDTAGVCMQIQLPRCSWGTTELQGGVHATAHHPAVRHRVSTLLPLYGIFVSFILCGETWLQGGCRHREQIHLDRYTKLWCPAALHHVRHPQGATKWQVGSTQQCILCSLQ